MNMTPKKAGYIRFLELIAKESTSQKTESMQLTNWFRWPTVLHTTESEDMVSKTYMDGLAEGYKAAMKEMQRILDELTDTYALLEEHLEEINNHPDRSVEVTA